MPTSLHQSVCHGAAGAGAPAGLTMLCAHAAHAGVNACVEDGRLSEAQALMRWMREQGLRPGHGCFNMLLKYHTRRGDMVAARRVWLDMRKAM